MPANGRWDLFQILKGLKTMMSVPSHGCVCIYPGIHIDISYNLHERKQA
jgi:hypothetical protein